MGSVHGPGLWAAVPVIRGHVTAEDAPEVGLMESDTGIQAFATKASDEALHRRVRPWRTRGDHQLFQVPDTLSRRVPIHAVAVASEIP